MTFLQSLRRSVYIPLIPLVTMVWSLVPKSARADDAAPPAGGAGGTGGFDTSIASSAGGSSKGTGSALNVDTSSGTMQTSIPFESPKARGAIQPSLALSYSSAAGPGGTAGMGWGLAVGAIERRPRSGKPQYHDPANGALLDPNVEDQFVFNGRALSALGIVGPAQEEGMPSFATGGGWTYFRLVNDDFTRFFWSPDHRTWIVQFKGGETWELGVPLSATFTNPADQVAALDVDRQVEPGKAAAPAFRWNLSVRYDSQGGYGHAVNRIVYHWQHFDAATTLADLGSLVDVYDTPNIASADSLSTDPAIFAHHTHLSYKPSARPAVAVTPVWRAAPVQLLDHVDVSTAEDGKPQRALLHRYTMSYAADAKSPQVQHLVSVGIEGRCASPLLEQNGVVPTSTKCMVQPQTPTMTYTSQTAFAANTTPAQITSSSVNMPVKGAIPTSTDNVNPYLYDVNGDGFADIVYGDNDGSDSNVTGIKRQWTSVAGQTFTAFDNVVAPQVGLSADFQPFAPGDFTGLQQLSVLVSKSTAIPTGTNQYPVVSPVYQASSKTWHWGSQIVSLLPLDIRTTTANTNDRAPYSSGNPPAEGMETRAERSFAIADFDGDGYLDQLTATDIDDFGWIHSLEIVNGAWQDYYAKGSHRRLGTFLSLHSTQKTADGQIRIFGDYAADRAVDHVVHAPAANVAVPPAPLTGTQYVGRIDAANMQPFQVDPFWSDYDKARWTPPAEAPLDASLMYNDPFFADMNGDGLPDWVVIPPGKSTTRYLYYWPGHGDGTFGECGPAANCSTAYTGKNAVAMLLPSVDALSVNIPVGSFPNGFPEWPVDPERYVRDVTGDGLADLVVLEPSGIDVYQNINGALFSSTKTVHTDASLLTGYDILPRTCPNHACSYVGNAKPKTRLSFGDPYGAGHESMVLMTVVNNGSNASNAYRVDMRVIDILGSQPVGLMETQKNGAGLTTKVTYETTTHQAQSAQLPTSLTGPWTRSMPIVKFVASHIETTNNMPGVFEERHATDFAFQDPIYDGLEHVFRGFRKAVRFERDDANKDGVITATSYFTGLCDADPWSASCVLQSAVERPIDALRGLPWLTEVYSLNGAYRSTVVNRYEVRTSPHQFVDKRHAHYVVPLEKNTYLYDGTAATTTSSVLFPVATILDPTNPTKNESDRWVTIHGSSEVAPAVVRLTVRSEFDPDGNVSDIWDDGVAGKDDSIHTKLSWARIGTDWTWRLAHRHVDALPASVTSSGFPDRDLDVTYDYDAFGNTKAAHSPLVGSSPASKRFHETGLEIADPPLNASVDGSEVYAQVANFDAYGNVIQKMKGSGKECVSIVYDDAFKLFPKSQSAFSQPQCKGSSFSSMMKYDWGAGQPLLIVNIAGATATKTYDAFGRLQTVAKPDPLTGAAMAAMLTLYYGDATDNPVHTVHAVMSDSTGTSNSWTYTEPFGHELLSLRPADSTQDPKAWVVTGAALRDLNGRTIATYDPYFWGTSGSNAGAYPLTATGYDAVGALAQRTAYDAFGRAISTTGRDGLPSARWAYHALSTDTFDAEQIRGKHQGAFTSTLKDGHGRTSTVTEWLHDAGSLQSVVTTTSYTARGFPRSLTKGNAPAHIFGYDSLGRRIFNIEMNTTRPQSARPSWTYTYDDDGNLVGTTDSRGCGENLYYDTNGRIRAEDYSPCLASQLPHSKPNLTTGDGTEAFYEYDTPTAGQVVSPLDVGSMGQLTQVSDRAARTRFAYDLRGRLRRVDRQVAAPGAPVAALTSRYAPAWSTKNLDYDDRDRPTRESTGADVDALLPGSVTTIGYSARGLPSNVTSTYSSAPLVKGNQFDADDFLRVVTYGDAATTKLTTTPDAVLRTVAGIDVTRTAPGSWSSAVLPYTSPASSFTTQTSLESLAFTPDLIGNPVTIEDKRNAAEWPDGAKPADKTLVYDDLYRVKSVTSAYKAAYQGKTGTDKQVSPFAAELADNTKAKQFLSPMPQPNRQTSETFSYDLLGNLTSWGDDASAFFDRSLGTITSGDGTTTGPHQLTHAQSATNDQMLDATYDVAGNLQLLTVTQPCADYNSACQHRFEYAWNEIGQLEHAKRWDLPSLMPGIFPTPVDPKNLPGTPADADLAFAYDASGTRVLKSSYEGGVLAGTTVSIFPSLRLEHAAWKNGDYERTTDTEAVYLTVGGTSFGRVVFSATDPVLNKSGTLHVFLEIGDHLGSTSVVVDQATGELVERTTYSAYGHTDSDYRPTRWNSFRESYRFTGQEDDAEVGLTYFGARYYAPQLGRFISADPVAVHTTGGDPNPYAYVRGHVSNATDPDGRDCLQEICLSTPAPSQYYNAYYGLASMSLPEIVIQGSVAPAAWLSDYMATQPDAPPDWLAIYMQGQTYDQESGAVWENPALLWEKWNPNATSTSDAMLMGSSYDMSWAHANPAEARMAAQIELTALSFTPVVGTLMLVSEAMDPTRSAGERTFSGVMAVMSIVPVGRIAGKAAAVAWGVETFSVAAAEEIPQLGGAYSKVRAAASEVGLGGQVHHMPSWGATREAGMAGVSRGSGPSIWMRTADHARTPSFGSSAAAGAYRGEQRLLIQGGRYLDALKMDVDAIRAVHGTAYDGAIQQMGEYVWSMGQ